MKSILKKVRNLAWIFFKSPIFGVRKTINLIDRTQLDFPLKISWSQSGEDLALLELEDFPKIGRYLDIGAHDPIRYSNTHALYLRGWRGVNVDADSGLIERFYKKRMGDTNVVAAVGSKDKYIFTVFSESALSTVEINRAKKLQSKGWQISGTRTVPGRSLRSIYDEYFPNSKVDLLNLDIEGNDMDALASMSFETLSSGRFPGWILVETSPPVMHVFESEIISFLRGFSYQIVLVLPRATLLKHEGD
jgi:FkbM family methyltransferase